MTTPTVAWYDDNAERLAPAYEALSARELRAWLAHLLPAPPAVMFDVGAGTGRDAVSLAGEGYDVVAVEPSAGMRTFGARTHEHPRLRWLADSLPSLTAVVRTGLSADVILLNAVWQHVAPADRARSFRKLVTLLKPGGLLAITLRHGPDDGRGAYEVSADEIEALARNHGMEVALRGLADDAMGRPGVRWTRMALRLPDDGTGALPLLRHAILVDQKSSTYKLGLLRALCRAADGAAGLAEEDDDGYVKIPLGLVALNWLRLYLPLTAADLPQSPTNTHGAHRLGFAGAGWTAVAGGAATVRSLRPGAVFGPPEGVAVWSALREAADLIRDMPARYLTRPDGRPVFPISRTRAIAPSAVLLDGPALRSFGTLSVPVELWRSMSRFAAWIEPALVAEWIRLMHDYAAGQRRTLDPVAVATATVWSDPDRGVGLPRKLALDRLGTGLAVHCVWSGRVLDANSLDMDHCLPWAAWPCGDLWNIAPADRRLNQHAKRGLLPSAALLRSASERFASWWSDAYLGIGAGMLPRFASEARASLPGLATPEAAADPAEVLAALGLQRLRLQHDQGVPEWDGPKR